MEIRDIRRRSDEGLVLSTGSGDYEVIVAIAPPPESIVLYGVFNKATRIVEAYISSFTRAKDLCTEFHRDSLLDPASRERNLNPLIAMFGGGSDDEGSTPPPARSN